MTDPRQPSQSDQDRHGSQPTQPRGNRYQLPIDPAYSGQMPPYGSVFPPPPVTQPNPTEPLPRYWLQGQSPLDWQHGQPPPGEPPHGGPSRPERPKTPRWLWIVATAAVLLVLALVIALLVTNSSAKKETAVPPLPAMPSSKTPPTASSAPASTPPTTTAAPSMSTQPSSAGAAATVLYNVSGEGRAISISYVDNDGVMQIEFNVALPWSKEVTLPKSGKKRANVTIVNIGHEVTCSVTVDGVQGRRRTGEGLTICDAAS